MVGLAAAWGLPGLAGRGAAPAAAPAGSAAAGQTPETHGVSGGSARIRSTTSFAISLGIGIARWY